MGLAICLAFLTVLVSAQVAPQKITKSEPKPAGDMEQATTVEATRVDALLSQGILAEESGKSDLAVKMYKRAIAEHEKERALAAQAIFRLAEVYRRLGADHSAVEYYKRIVSDFSEQVELVQKSQDHLKSENEAGYGGGAGANPFAGMDERMMARYGFSPGMVSGGDPKTAASGSGDDSSSQSTVFVNEESRDAENIEDIIEKETLRQWVAEKAENEGRLFEYESLLKALQGLNYNDDDVYRSVAAMVPDSRLNTLINELDQTDQALAESSSNRGSDHPDVKQLAAKLQRIEKQMKNETSSLWRAYKDRIRMARDRDARLNAMIDEVLEKQKASKVRHTVSVMGAVVRPTVINYAADETSPTIIEAIVRAGGFTDKANQKKIDVIREGKTQTHSFDALLESSGHIQVQDGDVIRVGERFF